MSRQQSRHLRARPRATFGSVLGELIMTAGAIILGYIVWQVTIADDVIGAVQERNASVFASQLEEGSGAKPGAIAVSDLRTDASPVEQAPAESESFAVIYIPRLEQFGRVVGEGTSQRVLDSRDQGLAHYAESAMPGGVGNFAVAGHRNGQGGPFTQLDEMRVGDRVYVKTAKAWYVYEFRNHEYVDPTAVGVVAPVPQDPDAEPRGRYLTLTTCHPEWSRQGRLVAYASLVGWTPIAEGTPSDLAAAMGGS